LIGSVANLSDATLSDGVDSDNSSTGAPLADPTATLRTLVDMPFMPLFGGCSFNFRASIHQSRLCSPHWRSYTSVAL